MSKQVDLIEFIESNEHNMNTKQKFDYCTNNNRSFLTELLYLSEKKFPISIPRYFDVLDKIILVIDKKIFDSPSITQEEIINFVQEIEIYTMNNFSIKLKIKHHNIILSNEYKVILSFDLSNNVHYKNKNIGGIPLFLFDRNYVYFKMPIDFDEYFTKDLIRPYIGGKIIVQNFAKVNLKIIQNIIMLGEQKENVVKELKCSNENIQPNNYDSIGLLNYLNVVSYKKKIINEKYIKWEFNLDQETTHLVFVIKNIYNIEQNYIRLSVEGYDIYDVEISPLYYKGYYVYKFNTNVLYDYTITLGVQILDNQLSDIDNITIEIYNVYDMVFGMFYTIA